MYHINNEGKIYPCRARVLECPYGPDMHADNREELYHKSLRMDYGEVEVPKETKREIYATGRLRSLYSMSEDIENNRHPLETIIQGLNYSIIAQKNVDLDALKKRQATYFFATSEAVYKALKRGQQDKIPDWIPPEIKSKAFDMLKKSDGVKGDFVEKGLSDAEVVKKIDSYKKLTEDYEEYKKFRLTVETYKDNMRWMQEDFYQFSHDFNTSKTLTQPIFYGNLKKARQTIASLTDEELLSAYDDYLVSDDEILDSVKLAKGFNYEYRTDLTKKANVKVKNWYDMNKKLAVNWEKNKAKRVLLSMELAKELDKRQIQRQERRRKY